MYDYSDESQKELLLRIWEHLWNRNTDAALNVIYDELEDLGVNVDQLRY